MDDFSKIKTQKAHRTLLMIGMFSIIMFFAGLTSAYFVSKGGLGLNWDVISLPNMFYVSTCMIFLSSVFGYFSIKYCASNNFKMITQSLVLTILFGILFGFFQFLGWKELINAGKYLSGNNVASSYIYILTITHLLHLIGGLIALIVVFFKSRNNYYNKENSHGLSLSIRFWHFLAFLWLYIIGFLLLIN